MIEGGDKQERQGRGEDEQPFEVRRPRSSRWRRWLWRVSKGIFFLLLLLGVILYGALLYLRTDHGRMTLRDQILERTAELLPGLCLGGIEGDYTSHLGLNKLVLKDRFGGEAISVEHIAARYDLTRLASQQLRIDEVRVLRPRIVLRPTKSGKDNLAELLAPRPVEKEETKEGASPWTIHLGALRIEGGSFDAPGIGSKGIRVSDLHLNLGAKVAGERVEAILRDLRAQITTPDGRQLRARVNLRAQLRGQTIDAKLHLEAQQATSREPVILDLSAKGTQKALTVALDGRLPGAGTVTLRGTLGQDGEVPHGKAELTLTHIMPREIVPGLG
ncbi:MAG: hypothetical protein JRH20_17045, partial [Deltaproteobacteria bacterium]|nr:hypothetical protein [Deltaproteobacteria bacterium]